MITEREAKVWQEDKFFKRGDLVLYPYISRVFREQTIYPVYLCIADHKATNDRRPLKNSSLWRLGTWMTAREEEAQSD